MRKKSKTVAKKKKKTVKTVAKKKVKKKVKTKPAVVKPDPVLKFEATFGDAPTTSDVPFEDCCCGCNACAEFPSDADFTAEEQQEITDAVDESFDEWCAGYEEARNDSEDEAADDFCAGYEAAMQDMDMDDDDVSRDIVADDIRYAYIDGVTFDHELGSDGPVMIYPTAQELLTDHPEAEKQCGVYRVMVVKDEETFPGGDYDEVTGSCSKETLLQHSIDTRENWMKRVAFVNNFIEQLKSEIKEQAAQAKREKRQAQLDSLISLFRLSK